jgi:hypothetical protein
MAFVHNFGWNPPAGKIKSAPVANGVRVGALGVRFSGPSSKDLAGEYFTQATEFGDNLGNGAPVLLNHGTPLGGLQEFADFASVVLAPATVTRDSKGLFVETTLDTSDPLQAALVDLVTLGALRWSSGSADHVIKRAPNGEILRWFPVEFSMTPSPCEFRLPAIGKLS